MTGPNVPIEVDPESGVWSTDGLPMLYMPRHFFINNHLAIEHALGRERYAKLLYDSGYKSAYSWCDSESDAQGLSGMAVFHHYMKRLSQRGWGQFDGSRIDPGTGCGEVHVSHSCFVRHLGQEAGRKLCYMFAGWFPGSLDWTCRNRQRDRGLRVEEVACGGEGHEGCVFVVARA